MMYRPGDMMVLMLSLLPALGYGEPDGTDRHHREQEDRDRLRCGESAACRTCQYPG